MGDDEMRLSTTDDGTLKISTVRTLRIELPIKLTKIHFTDGCRIEVSDSSASRQQLEGVAYCFHHAIQSVEWDEL